MKVFQNIKSLPSFSKAVITIGTFDGVHQGHKKVLGLLKEEAASIGGETVILTFHPHPRNIVDAAHIEVSLINTIEERIELIRKEGIENLVVIPFTEEFSKLTAGEYVENFLISNFHPHTLVIGYDHHFGFNRAGDYRLLEIYEKQGNFTLKEIPAYIMKSNSVSSTSIRNFLKSGETERANELLGYRFFITGTVAHGNKIGRQLGFPTANINVTGTGKLLPADGIYAVTVSLPEYAPDKLYKGMLSIGFRPTVDGNTRVIEVNIFDFSADIYHQQIRVHFHKYLRPEYKFENLEQLSAQMEKDKTESLEVLKGL